MGDDLECKIVTDEDVQELKNYFKENGDFNEKDALILTNNIFHPLTGGGCPNEPTRLPEL